MTCRSTFYVQFAWVGIDSPLHRRKSSCPTLNAFVASFGALFVGPMLNWWYFKLERWFPKNASYSVIKKVVTDQTLAAPANNFMFYSCLGILVCFFKEKIRIILSSHSYPLFTASYPVCAWFRTDTEYLIFGRSFRVVSFRPWLWTIKSGLWLSVWTSPSCQFICKCYGQIGTL